MSDDKLESDIRRGNRAKELLENELFEEAWTSLREIYTSAWAATTPLQSAEREKLYIATGILKAVRANFVRILNTGTLGEADLEFLIAERNANNLQAAANKGTNG